MKIGILTLPLHTNYGGILQAYALQTVLQRMGHDVFILNPLKNRSNNNIFRRFYRILKNTYLHFFKDRNTIIFFDFYIQRNKKYFSKAISRFIQTYLNIYSISDFKSLFPNSFDAYVVGSDQIWRPQFFTEMWNSGIENGYLKFASQWKVKRIAYAASLGGKEWEYDESQTEVCKDLLAEFDAVSVRERDAIDLIDNYLSIRPEWVLDPTFLLGRNDYMELINNLDSTKENIGLFSYILDDNAGIRNMINKIALENCLSITDLRAHIVQNPSSKSANILKPVEYWLKCFRDAELIVTDSFHACIFSIIFEKKFLVVKNSNRGTSRFETLLSLFNLEKNIVTDYSANISLRDVTAPNNAEILLNKMRKVSVNFLQKAL